MIDYIAKAPSIFSRRAILGGAAALVAVAPLVSATSAFAQDVQMQTYLPPGIAPGPKGPLVFLDYDQEELNYAYDQGPWSLNSDQVLKRNAQQREATLARLGAPKRISYGSTDIEKADIYLADRPKAPILVFIHGGAWRGQNAAMNGYMAEPFHDAGAVFIALDFINVIDAGGSLLTMAEQVRQAIAWVYKNADSFGGDANQLYVAGHSSGAHLAGVALTTDWSEFGLPADCIKGGLCASGLYELEPVTMSARAAYVTFTPETVEKLSSLRHLDKLVAPIVVTHGSLETPEFQRQNREFAAAVKAAGKPVTFTVLDGYNHFEGFVTMGNPYGVLGRATLELMQLSPKAA